MSHFALAAYPPPFMQVLTPHPQGAGTELEGVERRAAELLAGYHDSLAITYREALLAETFHQLADEWRNVTAFDSSPDRITRHETYRAIVDLGEEVAPLIMRDLRRRPELWFAALRELLKVDPVRPEQRGNVRAMADTWLEWGRNHGLLR